MDPHRNKSIAEAYARLREAAKRDEAKLKQLQSEQRMKVPDDGPEAA
jgi:hypothetical protein